MKYAQCQKASSCEQHEDMNSKTSVKYLFGGSMSIVRGNFMMTECI